MAPDPHHLPTKKVHCICVFAGFGQCHYGTLRKGKWGLQHQQKSTGPQAAAHLLSCLDSPAFSHSRLLNSYQFICNLLPSLHSQTLKPRKRHLNHQGARFWKCWGTGTPAHLFGPWTACLGICFELSLLLGNKQDTWVGWIVFCFTFHFFYLF